LPVVGAAVLLAACSSASPAASRTAHHHTTSSTSAAATSSADVLAPQATAGASSARGAVAAQATPPPAGTTGHVAPAAASGPLALHPPAAGTYAYTRTDDSGTQNVDVAVSPLQGSSDSLTWHSSSGGQAGQLDATLSWPGSGMLVTQLMLQGGTTSYTCTLSPPIEAEASPLATGTAWNSDSTCSVAGGTLRWVERDHVTGTDTVQVGGASVLCDLVAVSRTITFTTATGTITSDTTASSWFAPLLGLEVRDQSTSTNTSGGQTKTSSATMQLESTQPQ
jgi:hypothetical protein